jgi:hypothetical protein
VTPTIPTETSDVALSVVTRENDPSPQELGVTHQPDIVMTDRLAKIEVMKETPKFCHWTKEW